LESWVRSIGRPSTDSRHPGEEPMQNLKLRALPYVGLLGAIAAISGTFTGR
jgi:hypothetical protein